MHKEPSSSVYINTFLFNSCLHHFLLQYYGAYCFLGSYGNLLGGFGWRKPMFYF